jgi:hypothetical protein
MSELALPRSLALPTVSYAPFRLLEAVPWLMFAAAMRTLTVRPFPVWLAADICSDVSIFFAFLLAARRMIEFNNGRTKLGRLTFSEQLKLARCHFADDLHCRLRRHGWSGACSTKPAAGLGGNRLRPVDLRGDGVEGHPGGSHAPDGDRCRSAGRSKSVSLSQRAVGTTDPAWFRRSSPSHWSMLRSV